MGNNNIITIFTPTFNRAEKLSSLYRSLEKQTCKDFVWLIVDDGSKDDTECRVRKWIDAQKIKIIYLKQDNQGKHVAHNLGVDYCTTLLFSCVDSDDTLIDTAIEDIIDFYATHEKEMVKRQICGIIAWRGLDTTNKLGKAPSSYDPCSLGELYHERGMTGDTMIIYKTEVIKKYPFPVFPGEKFLRESLSYNRIDENYKYLIFDKVLYLCEYFEDGLSRNASWHEIQSPKGAAAFRWEEAKLAKTKKGILRNRIAYVFFNRLGNNNKESLQRLGIKYIPYWLLSWSGYIHYRQELKRMKILKEDGEKK